MPHRVILRRNAAGETFDRGQAGIVTQLALVLLLLLLLLRGLGALDWRRCTLDGAALTPAGEPPASVQSLSSLMAW